MPVISTCRPACDSAGPPSMRTARGRRHRGGGGRSGLVAPASAAVTRVPAAGDALRVRGHQRSPDNAVTAYDAATGTITANIPVGDTAFRGGQPGRPHRLRHQQHRQTLGDQHRHQHRHRDHSRRRRGRRGGGPDGGTVYATGVSDVVAVSTANPHRHRRHPRRQRPVSVAVSPDSRTAYVANGDDYVSVISTATGIVTATIPVGPSDLFYSYALAVIPDGKTLYLANGFDGSVWVISTATNTVTATIPDAGGVGLAVSPDGKTLYVTDGGNLVYVICTATNTVTATFRSGTAGVLAVAFSRDGSAAYVANGFDNDVSVISTATDKVTGTFPTGLNPVALATTVVPPPAPAVTGVSPAHGTATAGTSVTITGTGLAGATAVHFGTTPAKFTADSATTITATAPAANSGTVNVTVTTPSGTSPVSKADQYTYQPTVIQADLSAGLSCPGAITRGHDAACTLSAANTGPAAASQVTAYISLPGQLKFLACTPACTRLGGTATWNLPSLASGAKATLTLRVRAASPGKATATAKVTASTPDPSPRNNAAAARITITRRH